MKKLNYLFLGLAGLAMASCSQEDLVGPNANDGKVHFKVQLPIDGVSTRAFGTGQVANNLYMAVYDADNGNALIFQDLTSYSFTGTGDELLTTEVALDLASGKKYNIAFFALSQESQDQQIYDFNAGAGTLSVNYAKMTSDANLQDVYDCYYRMYPIGPITNNMPSQVVELNRPVCQINWGTNDLTAQHPAIQSNFGENGEYIRATLTTNAYGVMDLFTSEVVEGSEVLVNLANWSAPVNEAFPVGQGEGIDGGPLYKYVAMQYLLAPKAESAVYDLTLNISNAGKIGAAVIANDVVVSNAPVQANYRTNIYGSLLSENIQFIVEKDPNWGTPDFDLVNGAVEPPVEDGKYVISTQQHLEWLQQQVNAGNSFAGETFILANDIYMFGNWSPIGTDQHHGFSGTFDGQGNTIHNMIVESDEMTGFFGYMNGKVTNLNFDYATVVSNHWAGVVVGYSDNETGGASVTYCNVSNSKVTLSCEPANNASGWDNGDKGGLIIGYMATKDQVENCTVTDCTLTGYRDLGGIIGIANGSVVNNNKVNGLTIFVDQTHNPENYTDNAQYNANPVIGRLGSGAQQSGNSYENVNIIYGKALNNETVPDYITGGDYILTEDFEYSGSRGKLIVTGNADIDLNGYELTAVGDTYGDALNVQNSTTTISNGTVKYSENASGQAGSAAIIVSGGKDSNVTLEDLTVIGGPSYAVVLTSAAPNSIITINSGTYYSDDAAGCAIYINKTVTTGRIVINGGTFGQPGKTPTHLLNIWDALVTESSPANSFITVMGGTFINWNPADNKAEGPGTNFLAEGYKVVVSKQGNDTYYTVVKE